MFDVAVLAKSLSEDVTIVFAALESNPDAKDAFARVLYRSWQATDGERSRRVLRQALRPQIDPKGV